VDKTQTPFASWETFLAIIFEVCRVMLSAGHLELWSFFGRSVSFSVAHRYFGLHDSCLWNISGSMLAGLQGFFWIGGSMGAGKV